MPSCTSCGGLVKPDIVFFGENLPERFFQCVKADFPKCDLLIILGTSLVVQPFASLVDRVGPLCPRLLINNEVGDMSASPSPGRRWGWPVAWTCWWEARVFSWAGRPTIGDKESPTR